MGMNQAWVERQGSSDEARRFHESDRLAVWTMDEIAGLMDEKNVSKADLARKIGTSRSYVTQLFSGSKNPTLATVADLAWALGFRAYVKFEPLRTGEFMSVPVQLCKVLSLQKRYPVNSVTRMPDPKEGSSSFCQHAAVGAT
jgi:transcriptional regulator with XRE-family HTH domain